MTHIQIQYWTSEAQKSWKGTWGWVFFFNYNKRILSFTLPLSYALYLKVAGNSSTNFWKQWVVGGSLKGQEQVCKLSIPSLLFQQLIKKP